MRKKMLIITKRKSDCEEYDKWLLNKGLERPLLPKATKYNYAYYPVIFTSEQECLNVFNELERNKIYARRYFYPSLSHLDYVEKQATPISDDIAARVLCLPLYYDISKEEIGMICRIIIRTLKY